MSHATSYGIGYGQNTRGGGWRNEHFPSREAAEDALFKLKLEVAKNFSKPSRNWTGDYSEDVIETESNPHSLKTVSITNLKKNGKRGAVTFTFRLYSFDAPICDPWYRGVCPGCKQLIKEAA